MERLTKRSNKTVHENGVCCTHYLSKECEERSGYCTDECPWEEAAWSRLADYEDLEEKCIAENYCDLKMLLLRWKEFFDDIAELYDYRAIGTVSEFRELKEKATAKKPIPIDYEKYTEVVKNAKLLRGAYWCPNCNHVVKSGDYCNDCGQKLDWSEGKE